MTEAIGTQNVSLPSSVCHADLATGEKFFMPGRSSSLTRFFFLYISSETSNGRQVMRSPAVPPAMRALSAALYSVGAEGENSTVMSGCFLLNGGMICEFQMSASSLRQLSILILPA